ncbi:hypothetical protein NHH03_17630 [Stieleria sp. TO1_6]|uniref:hypothetical protein n=1 Tax=Stieleria tagensis TaxID=2956795 RepID=UPI00209A9A2A|nr:hypothetical protein [Stieleria tagensis]MCO8123570.1 hypothetical protein [Stieleria tagensis]
MGRPKRADEAGGIYHALNRGNAKTDIFQERKRDGGIYECLRGRPVGHQRNSEQLDRVLHQTYGENSFEGEKIFFFVKHRLPLIAAIEGMVNLAGRENVSGLVKT